MQKPVAPPNLQAIHELAMKSVVEGRKVLDAYFGRLSMVEEKDLAGLVSEADRLAENAIEGVLLRGLPGVPVLGEERSYSEQLDVSRLTGGTRWILDPLDGTTNYIHQFHVFGISLALEWQGDLLYGVVDLPKLGLTYHAVRGQGAFKNGQKIHVSRRETLATSLLATGFANSRKEVLKRQVEVFAHIVDQVRGIRRAGSAAFDLCMVAEGVFDAYWESGLQAWDVAAGALLVSEAGGQVTAIGGEPFQLYSGEIVASNRHIHKPLVEHLKCH